MDKPFIFSKACKWSYVDPIVVALTVSIILTLILAFTTKQDMDQEHIEKTFKGV